MELLILSSLEWKMNPVTPLAIFDYTMRRLGLVTHRQHSEFMKRFETIVLTVINGKLLPIFHKSKFIFFFKLKSVMWYLWHEWYEDSRSLVYLPSVMAAAVMLLVFKDLDLDNSLDYQHRLKDFLEINEVCSLIILYLFWLYNYFHN